MTRWARWTAYDDARVREFYPTWPTPKLAEMMGRSPNSVKVRATRLHIRKRLRRLPKDTVRLHPLIAALLERRLALGIEQRHIAAQIGVGPGNLCDWERGHHQPTFPFLVAWCEVLGMKLGMTEEAGPLVRFRQRPLREIATVDETERVCGRGGATSRPLTRQQFAMVQALIAAAPNHVTREQLFAKIWGTWSEAEIKIVDVYVCHVRKKIAGSGLAIRTIWGVGYVIEPASAASARAA